MNSSLNLFRVIYRYGFLRTISHFLCATCTSATCAATRGASSEEASHASPSCLDGRGAINKWSGAAASAARHRVQVDYFSPDSSIIKTKPPCGWTCRMARLMDGRDGATGSETAVGRTDGRTDTLNKNDHLPLIFHGGGGGANQTTAPGQDWNIQDAGAAGHRQQRTRPSRCQLLMLVVGG